MAYFKYLRGLNSLRFFAAFFVIISHGNISLCKLGIIPENRLAVFSRGEDAVNFFFTLSGFLITYLLMGEIRETGNVSIKQFYLRRVFRIWPLYFLVATIGFVLLGVIYPKVYHYNYFNFPVWEGVLFFIFFLPNYIAKNYLVGLLFPLWSIGVEEQFYLFWAPLVKLFKKHLKVMIILFVLLSTVFYILIYFNFIVFSDHIQRFLLSQKFFAMATGSIFAYVLFNKYEWYDRSIFSSKPFQLAVLLVIFWHYLVGFPFSESIIFRIICSFLYGILILNVSVISKPLINIEKKPLIYLGIISYGLYMYHMLIDYILRLITPKFAVYLPKYIIIPSYFVFLLSGTILVSSLSYKYFEKYFLAIKDRLHSKA